MSLKNITRRDLTDKLGITEKLSVDRCELDPVSIWKRETEFGTIEKIALCMEEDFVNHIYLCLPHGAVPGVHLPAGTFHRYAHVHCSRLER